MTTTPTSSEKVALYNKVKGVFKGLFTEAKELSKKRPSDIMSKQKVALINQVLKDVEVVTSDEPQAAYVQLLDEVTLPQNSDAVLVMVQHEAALSAFKSNHFDNSLYDWLTED